MASAELSAHAHMTPRRPASASVNDQKGSAPSSDTSAYVRASCEYHTSHGLTEMSSAATSAVRLEASRFAVTYTSGTIAVPNRADRARSPASPVPNALLQAQART